MLASSGWMVPSCASLRSEVFVVISFEKPIEHRQDGFQRIPPSEVGDDFLFHLAVVAHRTDDANVLMHGAIGRGHFHRSNEHDGYHHVTDTIRQA